MLCKNPLSKILKIQESIASVFNEQERSNLFSFLRDEIEDKALILLTQYYRNRQPTSVEEVQKLHNEIPLEWIDQTVHEFLTATKLSKITDPAIKEKIRFILFDIYREIWDSACEIDRVRLESVEQYLKTQSKFTSGHIFIQPLSTIAHEYHRDPIRVLPIWESLLKEASNPENIREKHWWGIEIECCLAPKRKLGPQDNPQIALPIYAAFEYDSSIQRLSKDELPVELVLPPLEKHILFNHVRHWINTIAETKNQRLGYKILGGPKRQCGIHISTILHKSTANYLYAVLKTLYKKSPARFLKWCGRTKETIRWAHPFGFGKYTAIHFRHQIDDFFHLYEIRIFQTPPILTYTKFLTIFHKLENLLDSIITAKKENIPFQTFAKTYDLKFKE